MASLVKDLVEAGIHFGHRATNWNPKMRPYIFGKRNKIHVIDVRETVKGLLLARKFITRTVGEGKDVLFVGTKRQARNSIEAYVTETGMPFVVERWLGGTLTNFRTIRERLKRLVELERLDESGEIQNYSKKMESQLHREKTKIKRNLEGIRNMDKMPGAVVVIDARREVNALHEARKLGIPTVCLIDTDSDPDLADIAIPGNDDAMRSIDVVIKHLCAAVMEGLGRRTEAVGKEDAEQGADGGAASSQRSQRAQFRAEEPATPAADSGADAAGESAAPVAASDAVAAQTSDASPAPALVPEPVVSGGNA